MNYFEELKKMVRQALAGIIIAIFIILFYNLIF